VTTALHDILACPRCDKALDPADEGFDCVGCDVHYPLVGGVPWLFAEPNFSLAEWRQRLDFLKRRLEHDLTQLDGRLADRKDLLALTRQRLEQTRSASADHLEKLAELLAPLEVERPRASFATYLALRTRLPPDQGLLTYYPNLHRDWCWGQAENDAALGLVRPGFDGAAETPRVLVLGSGAGRLAYDIHAQLGPAATVALDFNPLFQLAVHRIVHGATVELYEFPLAPLSATDHAVLRSLAAPARAREGFELVLADALRAPFRPAAFDVVVTPWLIDIVPDDLATLALRVNALLAKGGRWINVGSLAFTDATPERQYGPDECVALIEAGGFSSPTLSEATIPYMCSPASRHGRRETVLAWATTKTNNAKRPPRHEALPDWLVKGSEPVPLLEAFKTQAATARIFAGLMSLIDGRRSIKDIAKLLVGQQLLAAGEAEPAIREFLTKMYYDSQRARRL